jgi:hypothetical protein
MDGGGGQAVVHEGFKSNIGHFAINDRKTFGQDAIQKFVGAHLSRSHDFGNNLKVQGNRFMSLVYIVGVWHYRKDKNLDCCIVVFPNLSTFVY